MRKGQLHKWRRRSFPSRVNRRGSGPEALGTMMMIPLANIFYVLERSLDFGMETHGHDRELVMVERIT